jgi:hypothetical protein
VCTSSPRGWTCTPQAGYGPALSRKQNSSQNALSQNGYGDESQLECIVSQLQTGTFLGAYVGTISLTLASSPPCFCSHEQPCSCCVEDRRTQSGKIAAQALKHQIEEINSILK